MLSILPSLLFWGGTVQTDPNPKSLQCCYPGEVTDALLIYNDTQLSCVFKKKRSYWHCPFWWVCNPHHDRSYINGMANFLAEFGHFGWNRLYLMFEALLAFFPLFGGNSVSDLDGTLLQWIAWVNIWLTTIPSFAPVLSLKAAHEAILTFSYIKIMQITSH